MIPLQEGRKEGRKKGRSQSFIILSYIMIILKIGKDPTHCMIYHLISLININADYSGMKITDGISNNNSPSAIWIFESVSRISYDIIMINRLSCIRLLANI